MCFHSKQSKDAQTLEHPHHPSQANELMSKIHNTKKRMPVILRPDMEKEWLANGQLVLWNDELVAEEI